MAKVCKIENCNNSIWSKGLCKNHITKKPLSNGKGLTSKKSSLLSKKLDKSKDDTLKMKMFFMDCWKVRPHRSEISSVYLGSEPMSTYFHHILPKSKYPKACFDKENIIFLSLDEHTNVEADIYKYEEINRRRELLKVKYGIL
jgi:hypothetical protein